VFKRRAWSTSTCRRARLLPVGPQLTGRRGFGVTAFQLNSRDNDNNNRRTTIWRPSSCVIIIVVVVVLVIRRGIRGPGPGAVRLGPRISFRSRHLNYLSPGENLKHGKEISNIKRNVISISRSISSTNRRRWLFFSMWYEWPSNSFKSTPPPGENRPRETLLEFGLVDRFDNDAFYPVPWSSGRQNCTNSRRAECPQQPI